MKKCSCCKSEYPLNLFYKNRSNKDGYSHECKQCHSDRHCKRIRKMREEHPEVIHAQEKKYRINNVYKCWASRTLCSHKKQGIKVEIKTAQLEQVAKNVDKCVLCGVSFSWYGNMKVKHNSPTLDRVNNEMVLSFNNMQIICHRCNASKQDRTMKEFIDYCKMISKKFPKY